MAIRKFKSQPENVVEHRCKCGGYPFVRVVWWYDNEFPCKDCYVDEVERRYKIKRSGEVDCDDDD